MIRMVFNDSRLRCGGNGIRLRRFTWLELVRRQSQKVLALKFDIVAL
jgi:hypothetical protein